jgi:hypothetical protein
MKGGLGSYPSIDKLTTAHAIPHTGFVMRRQVFTNCGRITAQGAEQIPNSEGFSMKVYIETCVISSFARIALVNASFDAKRLSAGSWAITLTLEEVTRMLECRTFLSGKCRPVLPMLRAFLPYLNRRDIVSRADYFHRWMLREAGECGIKFDPVGIALQPALVQSLASIEGSAELQLTVTELRVFLKEDTIDLDALGGIRNAIQTHLSDKTISQVIHKAAEDDTVSLEEHGFAERPNPSRRRNATPAPSVRSGPKTPLKIWWKILEVLPLETISYDANDSPRRIWR